MDSLTASLTTGQGAVHECFIGQEIFEAGAETCLVVVPLQAVLLGLTHDGDDGGWLDEISTLVNHF